MRFPFLRPSLLLTALLVLAACDSTTLTETSIEDTTFAPELGVNLSQMTRLESGVYIRDLEVGEGPQVLPGQRLRVYYEGWLPDGTRFDGRTSGAPFTFVLGVGNVIQGWHLGLDRARIGSTRQLVIPSRHAYGGRQQGDIPPFSNLVFRVEILGIE